MKSTWRILSGLLALVLVGLGLVWAVPGQELAMGPRLRGAADLPSVQGLGSTIPLTVTLSGPYTPTLSVAVRDLPPFDPGLPNLDREGAGRDDHGFVGPDIQMPPHGNPLVDLQRSAPAPAPDAFGAPLLNVAGVQSGSSPPDDTGDVGPNHYLQGDNGPGGSRITVYNKSGVQQAQFLMESLAASSPCNTGYCDPIVQYDELADRWMVTEFDSSGETLCVYVSRTADPTGQWWAYAFPRGVMQDYPKYGVWPDGYYIAANNGGTVMVLERSKMLLGQPAAIQSFAIGTLPGFGFQLTMPATLEGSAPPAGAPALFLRPHDTEVHEQDNSPGWDLMEMWTLHMDWTNPANSVLTALPSVTMADWDQTLCGTSNDWSCMSQPGTSQKLDPIREPLHYPLQYRNFGTHETLVGCFAEDVDGFDRAAVHWFEIRRTPPGSGNWVNYQEGVLGDGVGDIHRSVCSAAMDEEGNIAVGYTRTGANAPYYPSIYYSGRLASDPLGTMPYYDNLIWDATTSKTNNERWGDYAGIGVDPADGCTYWFTTEYGGTGQTRIAAFKFDCCPLLNITSAPETVDICVGDDAVLSVDVGGTPSCLPGGVVMSTSGRPGATTESWSDNPVTAPETTVLTIGNTGGLAAGTYSIDTIGTNGVTVRRDTIALRVATAAPEATALSDPENGAIGEATRPTFAWGAVDGATMYDLQVATDPAFVNEVISVTALPANSYVPGTALSLDTVYYWRVRAANGCGGEYSSTWAFRTIGQNCTTYPAGGLPRDISDKGVSLISTLAVGSGGSILDLNVSGLRGQHPYVDDLTISLRSPQGTQVLLLDRPCGEQADFNLSLDDEAASIYPCPPTGGGAYLPDNPLDAFDGEGQDGTWTLTVTDLVNHPGPGPTQSLDAWGLSICIGASLSADYSDLASSYGVAWQTGDGALRLGGALDWDTDTGFAVDSDNDTDNGVSFDPTTGWKEGSLVRIAVGVTGADGNDYLAGWFDWNDDGDFADPQEKVLEVRTLVAGSNAIEFTIPTGVGYADGREVNARLRLYEQEPAIQGSELPYGEGTGGEVEDDRWIPPAPTAVKLTSFSAGPAPAGILVTWETASEHDNAGFNLYRSATVGDIGVRLNEALIPSASPGGDEGAVYEFLDAAVLPGVTYYYTLEDVDLSGHRTPHGPVAVTLWRVYLPVVGSARP